MTPEQEHSHQSPVGKPASGWPAYPPPGFPSPRPASRLKSWFFYSVLVISLFANVGMYTSYKEYFAAADGPSEKYHSGDHFADAKLAVIRISGTIMPPFSTRIIRAIETARDDDSVKGVLLSVNSPGGFVTDSHQIYHAIRKLNAKKPVYVSMGSMAASGGYYIAMGAGEGAKIYAEPTTWTGSIGVIIPHYDVSALADRIGVRVDPLKTGEFKDALSPFREISAREKALWDNILNQAFDQFVEIIDENRSNLSLAQVRELATGQIFTAKDAKANGLVDEIGFEEDALAALQKKIGLSKARVVTYEQPASLLDALLGSTKAAADANAPWQALLEASVPRAMYHFSWGQPVPPRS